MNLGQKIYKFFISNNENLISQKMENLLCLVPFCWLVNRLIFHFHLTVLIVLVMMIIISLSIFALVNILHVFCVWIKTIKDLVEWGLLSGKRDGKIEVIFCSKNTNKAPLFPR
jgi:hypothetical protein